MGSNKFKFMRYIIALQEAFAAMVPFFLFSSMAVLFYYTIQYFKISLPFIETKEVQSYVRAFNQFSSIIAVAAIAYFLAKRVSISQIIAIQLSLAVFVTIVLFEKTVYPLELPYGFSIGTLYAPIVSTFFLYILYPYFSLRLPHMVGSRHIYQLLDYIFVFVIAYFITIVIYITISYAIKPELTLLVTLSSTLPDTIEFFLRDLVAQIFWFFGVHGQRIVNAIFGKDILEQMIVANLSYAEFNRLFVMLGGTGTGLSLLFALLFAAKEKVFKYLARISIPFVVFNINTLLIYPLIVFNRYLLFPFIFVPLFNFLVGYIFVNMITINWSDIYIPWTTPPVVNGYLKSGGDFRVIVFQVFLLLIDTVIYLHYVRKFFKMQSIKNHASVLKENLNIREKIESNLGVHSYLIERKVIESTAKLEKILPTLNEENLFVYYQPKVKVKDKTCNSFEALIRYKCEGKLTGPFFLNEIEQAGLAPIMDVWVAKQVKVDLEQWKKESFTPEVSINIHPDTLLDSKSVEIIISTLKNEKIKIEIVERGFFIGEKAIKSLQKFQKEGFAISIDDFGVGFSNLETLIKYNIQEIKLDKALIDTIESQKGYIACKKIVELCHEEGYIVVAEGVETKKQYALIEKMGIDYVQGFFFSPALPPKKAKEFAENMKYI